VREWGLDVAAKAARPLAVGPALGWFSTHRVPAGHQRNASL